MLSRLRARRALDQLIADWELYRAANEPGGREGPEGEKAFRELQARIAARVSALRANPVYGRAESTQQELDAMLTMLKRQQGRAGAPVQGAVDTFAESWQRHFIFLNQLRGACPQQADGRRRTAAPLPGEAAPRRMLPRWRLPRAGFVASVAFGGLLALVAWLAVSGTGLEREAASGRYTAASEGDAAVAVVRVANAASGALDWAGDVLSPVVEAYGSTVTVLLVAALVAALGYMGYTRR